MVGALVASVALVASIAGAGASEIVVRPGDTLSGLARASGVTVDDLTETNAIADPDVVIAGSTLRLPAAPRTHVVVEGDTLWSIARDEGTTVRTLRRLNDLDGARIRVGERLELPAAPIDGAEWGGSEGGPAAEAGDASVGTPRMLITPTGVVTPIIASDPAGWIVQTPCGVQATVPDGTVVGDVDVVLDAGHGGSENAATGPNGLMEKDLNLTVTLLTAELLEARGYRVGLTRTTDVFVPIAGRAAIVNAWEPDLFVSIHHNGGAVVPSSTPGTQVFHQHADSESRRAAGVLYEELYAAALQYPTAWVGTVFDGVSARLGDSGDDFYGVLRLTQGTPSALTEFLWLSNGPEADLLARDDVQMAQAQAIVDGVERWFETDDTGSGYIGTWTDSTDHGGGRLDGCVDPSLID